MAKLNAAGDALSLNQTTQAILALENFIKHVDVLTPKWISEASAVDLREFAQDLVSLLEETAPIALRTSEGRERMPASPRGGPA